MAQGILLQPVNRTSDDLTHMARVDRLSNEPTPEPSPQRRVRESHGRTTSVFLGLEQQIHEIDGLSDEDIANLPESYRQQQADMLDTLIEKIQELQDKLGAGGVRVIDVPARVRTLDS